MKGFFQNKRILYFDAAYTPYTIAIKQSFERQGGSVDFFVYNSHTICTRFKNKINTQWFLNEKHSRLKAILDSIQHKKYDYILIKAPFEAPHVFFEDLNSIFLEVPKVNYNWSSVRRYDFLPYRDYFNRIVSFDPEDCAKYHLDYYPLFFIDEYLNIRKQQINADKYLDLIFIGMAYSIGRYDFLKKIQNICQNNNLTYYFYMYQSLITHIKFSLKGRRIPGIKHKFLSHREIVKYLMHTKAVIDYPMDIQKGLTIRTFETLGAGVKLITTNEQILNEPFYSKDHILVLKKDLSNFDPDFIQNQQTGIAPEIDQYHIDNWVINILKL